MARYRVEVQRTVIERLFVAVDAESNIDAQRQAVAHVKRGEAGLSEEREIQQIRAFNSVKLS